MAVTPAPADRTDYPALFRTLLVRSVETALAGIDRQTPRLDEENRDRSLHALSLALSLPAAWPASRELLLAIAPPMEMQGYRHEWMDFLKKGIALATDHGDMCIAARLHLQLGRLYHLVNDYAAAETHLQASRQAATQIDDRETLVGALDRLAIVAAEQFDFPATRALVQAALSLLDPDDPACAPSHHMLGFIALHHEEWEVAIDHYERALALRVKQGSSRFVALAVRDLAYAEMVAGRYEKARDGYTRAVDMLGELDCIYDQALARLDLGIVHWYLGQYQAALACYALCEPVFLKTGSSLSLARLYNDRGLVLAKLDRHEEALASFAASVQIARRLDNHLESANVLESQGAYFLRLGWIEESVTVLNEALEELAQLPERPRHLYEMITARLREAGERIKGNPAPGSP